MPNKPKKPETKMGHVIADRRAAGQKQQVARQDATAKALAKGFKGIKFG